MSYRIVGDSCLEIGEDLRRGLNIAQVPLTLQVGGHTMPDDERFDRKKFISLAAASPDCPKSACPSPQAYKEACECAEDDVFIITLSSHLSGSCNSARVGRELYLEEHGPKNILVIDSESASAGESNLALAIADMYRRGMNFEQVSKEILRMRDEQKTYFVIDSLEPLRKNGRLTGLKAMFATALNIKPVMGADHGVIIKLDQTRGLARAFARMCEFAVKEAGDPSGACAVIAHCNCPERAEQVKAELEKRANFKKIIITETAGVATMYAGDGGIVMAVGRE